MIIAQLLLAGASEYERKSQQIDFAALSAEHDVRLGEIANADLVHIYAPRELDPAVVRDLGLPYVSNALPKTHMFRKTVQPTHVITPLKGTDATHIPEAVADAYFGNHATQQPRNRPTVGTFTRPSISNTVEQTAARIQRFRDDVDWLLFDTPPSPDDLRGVDLWVDPANAEDDFDGFVAEAIASGTTAVASRTAINTQRLEKGRTGILVPPRDPNEWTHAILAALFKPELRHTNVIASQQTASKFRPRHRARALIELYESILQ
ncbi:MAG TPA: glycosyltransferase [Thermoanaerobaculia bacterium]|nr:glycosyltransferase [Thermoanaerobaculia bacterium]